MNRHTRTERLLPVPLGRVVLNDGGGVDPHKLARIVAQRERARRQARRQWRREEGCNTKLAEGYEAGERNDRTRVGSDRVGRGSEAQRGTGGGITMPLLLLPAGEGGGGHKYTAEYNMLTLVYIRHLSFYGIVREDAYFDERLAHYQYRCVAPSVLKAGYGRGSDETAEGRRELRLGHKSRGTSKDKDRTRTTTVCAMRLLRGRDVIE